jgi:HAD superfamily hydrolase (TIGR01458 family)
MFSSIKIILLDLSGTIYTTSGPIADSHLTLKTLRKIIEKKQMGLLFLSNTTRESRKDVSKELHSFGIDIEPHEIMTPLAAAAYALPRTISNPLVFLSESSSKEFFDIRQSLTQGNSNIPSQQHHHHQQHDAIVVGLAPERLNYPTLNTAFLLLTNNNNNNKSIPFLACNRSKSWIVDNKGTQALGTGPFVTLLENATGKQAETVGKPSRGFFHEAVRVAIQNSLLQTEKKNMIQPTSILMIGDSIDDDIAGATSMGYQSILVRTGKYKQGDENRLPNHKPTYCMSSFSEFVHEFEKQSFMHNNKSTKL